MTDARARPAAAPARHRGRVLPRPVPAAAAVLVLLVGTGCAGAPPAAPPPPGAAEPATSPEPAVPPAGTVRKVGARPEGIVVDGRTRLVAVAVRDPSRLLLLDSRTGRVTRTVPLPADPRHLQLAGPGGPVLVPVEAADTLIEVPLPSGTTRSVRVGRSPHDATRAADGRLAVADEFGGSLSVVRADRVERTVGGLKQPGGVAPAGGGRVAAVDVGAFTLSEYDLATGARLASVPAGAGPTHVLADRHGRLVVVDTRGSALLLFGTGGLPARGRVPLPGSPYGMAYDPVRDRLWVALTGRNEVVGFDLAGDAPREVARLPTVRQPDTVAADPSTGDVWVTGTAAGELQTIRG